MAVADEEQLPLIPLVDEVSSHRSMIPRQVAGLLGYPGTGRVGGDPGEVHVASTVLDDEEDVEAAQEDGVDVGEVDREDRVGLRGQELSPGRAGPSGRRIDALFKMLQTVEATTVWPRPTSSPWTRLYPQRGFSRAIRSTNARIGGGRGGRPGRRRG
jgi:hypothetical protein